MSEQVETGVVGVLLAAGAGRRMGRPKALVGGAGGVPWVRSSAETLRAARLAPVLVVLGAERDEARRLVPDFALVVEADHWDEGMGASLRRGLTAATTLAPSATAALIHLVDLPDVGMDVIARLAAQAAPNVLARATYEGRVGHPVLLGRDHWVAVIASARGDQGARAYLQEHEVVLVECGDLASGIDVDRPEQLRQR